MLVIFTSRQQDKQLDFVANVYLKHSLLELFLPSGIHSVFTEKKGNAE